MNFTLRWLGLVAVFLPVAALGQESDAPRANLSPAETVDEAAASQWITSLVREHLPHQYEDTRHWGRTKRVFDGLHIHRDGLEFKTKRRWKDANHGTWKMYRVQLVDPREQFRLTIENVRRTDNGSVAFDLHADVRLAIHGRISEWRRDVQLFSISAEGVAQVRLTARCEVAMRLDPRRLPPDLVLAPKVSAAEVRIDEFRIHRISKLDGPVVREIGRGMRRALEEKLAEDQGKLADKLNRQIAKNEDKLRLSLHDALSSKWGRWIDAAVLERSGEAASPLQTGETPHYPLE